jgi:hypothetical protein
MWVKPHIDFTPQPHFVTPRKGFYLLRQGKRRGSKSSKFGTPTPLLNPLPLQLQNEYIIYGALDELFNFIMVSRTPSASA